MTAARRLALVLVLYLAADFVDASAPGVFFFDSALFLGTVVQSKLRAADMAEQPRIASTVSVDLAPHVPDGARAPTHGIPRPSGVVTTHAPLPRDATTRSSPPSAAAEDH